MSRLYNNYYSYIRDVNALNVLFEQQIKTIFKDMILAAFSTTGTYVAARKT